MRKILILTGDAAETLEVFYPYQRLLEAGYEVHIGAPEKKKLQFVVHDFVDGFDTYTEKVGHTWDADVAFADVDPADYVAIVVPGGRAPEYIRNDEDAKRIVRHFFEKNAPVAALCHGPMLLAAAGVLTGRTSSAYPALAIDVELGGGIFEDGAGVVDGNLVSGRAWPDHPTWMREFMKLLAASDATRPEPLLEAVN
ncbi:DJ-1/PfpI family protein [Cryobacterium sp. TMT1-21]|uniref:DJ-1/PfpI family protein n=1 Tax=unclassified Cryobacterium TaxID=2649013 RepID=UPI00106DB171|nr:MULTISPECIES: DJ-1/PfpI family protein [unclassified Cryobacterium]TFD08665.1 DJ-1/PfpI family protein [Cryobacterium sp. TMT1-21]TFD15865.1 DJ-1/PfpI family protein [Cryobacterium sp. TMT2-23]